MRSLRIQSSMGISETVRTAEPQNTDVESAKEDSSAPAQQLQEAQQARAIAKSKLGEFAMFVSKRQLQSAMYNPKELGVEKLKSSQESSTSDEVDNTSKKNPSILYNGHAGLGGNS